ncbi:MAG TPA: S9 family peptidase [Candidatus Limnocylindrales bacterium]|nr:S9 family peptidase [Candidatus Limnocylindrales bacterium]
MTTERTVAPYGSWRSPISVDHVVGQTILLGEPWLDGDDLYWLEGRPWEGGRRVLVRREPDGTTSELTPAPANVRTRVHEYGGGSYTVAGGIAVYSDFRDGRLYRIDPGATGAVAITPEGPWRYADLRFDASRRRFVCVREDHSGEDQPRNELVAVPLDGETPPVVLYGGPDFVAAPRVSPAGDLLAWLEWDLPDMPWDATRLRVATINEDGSLGTPELAAGGMDESIAQPEWSAEGDLHFVSDRSGWWNLYHLAEGPRLEALAPMDAEFADPAWIFGRSSYAFLPDGSIVAAARSGSHDRLFHVLQDHLVGEVVTPFSEFEGLMASQGSVAALVGAPDRPTAIVRFDPETLEPIEVVRAASAFAPEPAYISRPEPIEYATSGGRVAHALFYAPVNADFEGPAAEQPPLVVLTHGGPTSNASTGLELSRQFFTSRGIAVVDVDYGGSTGYGRSYRQLLNGNWGKVDVEDCVAAALFLADRGDVDPQRMAIMGGSAGGFTTLAALAFTDVFRAGISLFGVGDIEALARHTHKFESRYTDRLVGPLPEAAARYRERSPVYAFDRISCPVLVLQGLDDKVVLPAQAEQIVAALAENGIPYAYLAFEGEGHGFRGETAQRRTLEAQLSFLGQVFGFEPADAIKPVELVRSTVRAGT